MKVPKIFPRHTVTTSYSLREFGGDVGFWVIGWGIMFGVFKLLLPDKWRISSVTNIVASDSVHFLELFLLWVVLCAVVLFAVYFTKRKILWPLGLFYPVIYFIYGLNAEFSQGFGGDSRDLYNYNQAANLSLTVSLFIMLPICMLTTICIRNAILNPEKRKHYVRWLIFYLLLFLSPELIWVPSLVNESLNENAIYGSKNSAFYTLLFLPWAAIVFAVFYIWSRNKKIILYPLFIGMLILTAVLTIRLEERHVVGIDPSYALLISKPPGILDWTLVASMSITFTLTIALLPGIIAYFLWRTWKKVRMMITSRRRQLTDTPKKAVHPSGR